MSLEDKENELRRLEEELKRRETQLRLRELELEDQIQRLESSKKQAEESSFYETKKYEPSERKLQVWGRKLIKIGKFSLFVFIGLAGVFAAIRLGVMLAYLALAGLIGWIGYEMFLKEDFTPKK